MNDDTRLWRAIYGLYELLSDNVNSEQAYQSFFEQNKIAFTPLNLDVVESFEQTSPNKLPYDPDRGFRPEPDFIGASNHTDSVSVVDLKTPFVGQLTTSRSDGNREKFKAVAEQNSSQVTEYVESIRGSREAREVICCALGLQKISSYSVILIYGLSEENDLPLIERLCSQRKIPTSVVQYDVLLELLLERYAASRRDIVSRPGWSFTFHVQFLEPQSSYPAFLGEYGEGERNRLSVFLSEKCLIFHCADREGNNHQLSCEVSGSGPHHVRFEFSNDESGIYMSLSVNNNEQDLRVGNRKLDFDPDTSVFTLGANSKGEKGARFLLFTHYFISRTLDFSEKLSTYKHFKRTARDRTKALEFDAKSYMVRDGNGNLIQPALDCKPTLREVEITQSA